MYITKSTTLLSLATLALLLPTATSAAPQADDEATCLNTKDTSSPGLFTRILHWSKRSLPDAETKDKRHFWRHAGHGGSVNIAGSGSFGQGSVDVDDGNVNVDGSLNKRARTETAANPVTAGPTARVTQPAGPVTQNAGNRRPAEVTRNGENPRPARVTQQNGRGSPPRQTSVAGGNRDANRGGRPNQGGTRRPTANQKRDNSESSDYEDYDSTSIIDDEPFESYDPAIADESLSKRQETPQSEPAGATDPNGSGNAGTNSANAEESPQGPRPNPAGPRRGGSNGSQAGPRRGSGTSNPNQAGPQRGGTTGNTGATGRQGGRNRQNNGGGRGAGRQAVNQKRSHDSFDEEIEDYDSITTNTIDNEDILKKRQETAQAQRQREAAGHEQAGREQRQRESAGHTAAQREQRQREGGGGGSGGGGGGGTTTGGATGPGRTFQNANGGRRFASSGTNNGDGTATLSDGRSEWNAKVRRGEDDGDSDLQGLVYYEEDEDAVEGEIDEIGE